MAIIQINEGNLLFAQDVMDSIQAVLCRHEDMDFEEQIGILGVAIGSLLHQLHERDRKYCQRVLAKNVESPPQFLTTMLH